MNHKGNSGVAKAVREAIKVHSVFEPHYDPCTHAEKNLSACDLATGLEGLFVADIAGRLHQHIRTFKPQWAFNQFVYMPSTRIEHKCGFDISFGHFEDDSKRRVRLMHKLIRHWCDTDWKWDSNGEVAPKTKVHRCADHILMLVSQFRHSDGKIRPYISFSVHEYRRMGQPGIPSFGYAFRSLFIDLSPLSKILPTNFDSKAPTAQLVVTHQTAGQNPSIVVRRVSSSAQNELQASGWQEFQKTAGEFLLR